MSSRIANRMKNYMRDTLMSKVRGHENGITGKYNATLNYIKVFSAGKAKNFMGKEFYLSGYANIEKNRIVHEFFQKYIKNFDKNYVDNNGKIKPMINITKLDKGTFMYMSTQFYVPDKVMMSLFNDEDVNTDMYIYIFGKKSPKYARIFESYIEKSKEVQRAMKILIINEVSGAGSGTTDISVVGFDPRDTESLVYSNREVEKIVDHIDRYIDSTEFYKSKQLPYKTGILLYGSPGTGKSTIAKSLATKYNRNIVQINISNISKINFSELTTMINNDIYEQYIVLFEDIDTLYLNRESKEDKDANNVIQDLLQFLDSSVSPKNVIFIATTNHIDRLDKAIIRDGRFDLHVNVKGITKDQIKKFCEIFEVDYESNIDSILEKYGDPDEDGLYNQSKLQNILLQTRKPNMSEAMKEDLKKMTEDQINGKL